MHVRLEIKTYEKHYLRHLKLLCDTERENKEKICIK